MKKRIFYFFVFLFSFTAGFIYTFPADRAVSYYLKKAGIEYSTVKGNIFGIQITDIDFKKIHIDRLFIRNLFVLLDFYVDGESIASVNPVSRSADIHFDDFDIGRLVKGLKGRITGKNYVKIAGKTVYLRGKGDIFIENYPDYMLKNIRVRYEIEEGEKNRIKADINSGILKGSFSGEIFIPVDIKNGYIKGIFEGQMFGRKTKQDVYFRF